jgi:flagellar biosynthesis protein FlhG
VSINYLGAIPRDPDVTRAVQSRRPLLDAFPHSPAAKALADLAQTVAALESPPSPKGNIQFLWRRVLQVE